MGSGFRGIHYTMVFVPAVSSSSNLFVRSHLMGRAACSCPCKIYQQLRACLAEHTDRAHHCIYLMSIAVARILALRNLQKHDHVRVCATGNQCWVPLWWARVMLVLQGGSSVNLGTCRPRALILLLKWKVALDFVLHVLSWSLSMPPLPNMPQSETATCTCSL